MTGRGRYTLKDRNAAKAGQAAQFAYPGIGEKSPHLDPCSREWGQEASGLLRLDQPLPPTAARIRGFFGNGLHRMQRLLLLFRRGRCRLQFPLYLAGIGHPLLDFRGGRRRRPLIPSPTRWHLLRRELRPLRRGTFARFPREGRRACSFDRDGSGFDEPSGARFYQCRLGFLDCARRQNFDGIGGRARPLEAGLDAAFAPAAASSTAPATPPPASLGFALLITLCFGVTVSTILGDKLDLVLLRSHRPRRGAWRRRCDLFLVAAPAPPAASATAAFIIGLLLGARYFRSFVDLLLFLFWGRRLG